MTPTYAVVDTIDGAIWVKTWDGALFTEATATAFADRANAERKPEYRTYVVMNLIKRLGAGTHDAQGL
jgi:hypothetical protein